MVAIAPPAVVAAPPRAALPYGLYSVLANRPSAGGDRWENGVTWTSIPCDPLDGIGPAQCPPEDTSGLPLDLGTGILSGEAGSLTILADFMCSPVAWNPQDAQNRATERLLAREEARLEQALWTGDLGNAPNFSGANGAAAPTAVASDGSVLDAIAALEEYLSKTYGSLGVLHMSRRDATYAVKQAVLRPSSGRLLTGLGTPVVAGAGYLPGRIIATPALFHYSGDIFTSSGRAGDLLNRSNNDLAALAMRTHVIGFDPCALGAATVTPAAGDEG